jgi:mono/diheme cytochrome c family protein
MKVLLSRLVDYRWTLSLLTGLLLVLAGAVASWAQTPISHAVQMEGEDCLACHQAGVAGAPRLARDHLGRGNQDCLICHRPSGAPASPIPHPLVGHQECLACHQSGAGQTPRLSGNHVDYTIDECEHCHLPLPADLEPTPRPAPQAIASPAPGGAGSCMACHQLIFADQEHALFTGQPVGDAEAGARLFRQLCVPCHGLDGRTPVGDDAIVINSPAYWSTHDDAALLLGIGAGSQGNMTAFAQDYGGPLAWEDILDLTALVRSWGPVNAPDMPGEGELTFTSVIGPLLTERCGACHGGAGGLTVTSYAELMAGASSGSVITAGDPGTSRIVEVQQKGHFAQLSESELARLTEWISQNAPE